MNPQTQLDNANFIVDSGSGHHIVPDRHLPVEVRMTRTYGLIGAPLLATANGVIRPERGVQLSIDPLNITTTALVLENSPAVLSLGKLCALEGFTFHWESGRRPTLTDEIGIETDLEVRNFVPVLATAEIYACPITDSEATLTPRHCRRGEPAAPYTFGTDTVRRRS